MAHGRRGNNEGSLYQMPDGSRWAASISLPGGKRKVVYGKTRAEAARKLSSAIRDRDKGLPLVGERESLGAYLTRWLETARPTIRERSFDRYEEVVRLHVAPTLGKVPLARLTPAQLQGLYSKKLGEGMAPASVVKMHVVIRRALAQAERWGVVARNVATLVDRPRIAQQEMKTLSPEQARSLLAVTTQPGEPERHWWGGEAFYALALGTGLRLGELLALRWADVDLDSRSFQVRATLQQRTARGGPMLAEPKTTRSRRQVLLTSGAVEALRRHHARQAGERLKLGPTWEDNNLVFPNALGRPQEAPIVRRSFHALLERAGLPRIRFHDLRHTAATLLLGRGVHPKMVSEMLGHASIAITLDLYSHVTPTMQREAANVMESILHDG